MENRYHELQTENTDRTTKENKVEHQVLQAPGMILLGAARERIGTSSQVIRENLESIIDALDHGLEILRGDAGECGQESTA